MSTNVLKGAYLIGKKYRKKLLESKDIYSINKVGVSCPTSYSSEYKDDMAHNGKQMVREVIRMFTVTFITATRNIAGIEADTLAGALDYIGGFMAEGNPFGITEVKITIT